MISPAYHISFASANVGAKCFLLSLERFSETEPEKAQKIWDTIQENKIKGPALWRLYADASQHDFETMFELCSSVPGEVLIEASLKIGGSGRSFINEYFNNTKSPLTDEERFELDWLTKLRSIPGRVFWPNEFDRLQELNKKLFSNAGSPNQKKDETN